MSLSCSELLIGNSTEITLSGLAAGGVLLTDAECVASIVTASTGTPLTGAESLPMPYAGSPGKFQVIAPDTLSLAENVLYEIRAVATKTGVAVGRWRLQTYAKHREANHYD